jgi:hypothetical protein
MVKPGLRVEAAAWVPSVAFSVIVPIVLFSAFLLISRLAVRSINGPGDFPALFLCTLVGTLPIFRSGCSLAAKIVFSLMYIVFFGLLLGLFGFAIDCLVFHDCD